MGLARKTGHNNWVLLLRVAIVVVTFVWISQGFARDFHGQSTWLMTQRATGATGTSGLIQWSRKRLERRGYTWDAQSEGRELVPPQEIYFPPPGRAESTNLQDAIFDHTLTKEFETRYREKFGHTQAEHNYRVLSNPSESYRNANGFEVTAVQTNDDQRSFGDFMMRRLAEYHVDQFSKTNEKVRPVYEFKEKISKVEVQVSPGYSLSANYSFSGNSVDVVFKNPWVNSRIHTEVRSGGPGIGGTGESTLSLQRDFNPKLSFESHFTYVDGTAKVIGRRGITPRLSTSLTLGTYFRSDVVSPREKLFLAGFGYSF